MNTKTWKMAWKMLTKTERRHALLIFLVSIFGAGAQVAMIGAILPFLSYISDPQSIHSNAALVLMAKLFDSSDPYRFAVILGGTAVTIILASNLVLFLRSYMISRYTVMRIHSIGSRLLRGYLRRPYDFFLGRDSSDLSKVILTETNEICQSFLQPTAELVSSAIASISILAFLLYVEPIGTLVGGGIILGLYGGIFMISNRLLSKMGSDRVAANKRRFAAVSEAFGGIKDIKVHGKEQVYLARFEESSRCLMQANWRSSIVSDSPRFLIQALFFSAIVLACLAMIDPETFRQKGEAVSGLIPILGVFAFAGQRIVPEIQKVYSAFSKISYGAAALRNVYDDLMPPKEVQVPQRTESCSFESRLAFDGVSYLYPGSTAGISNLSLTIRPGERIGIVGSTGAGKTTFVDLALGLLEPQSGAIRSDGISISSGQGREGWKSLTAYVPQKVFISNTSFSENIAFGIPVDQIDHARIEKCARAALLHDHIAETELGYETIIGERGARLSGGQQQRIGIARALYQGAELLVLDEATSALDPITETAVMEAIERELEGATILMIAHRLDTLRNCSRILVFERGQVCEDGTWDDLIALNGRFQELASHSKS